MRVTHLSKRRAEPVALREELWTCEDSETSIEEELTTSSLERWESGG